MYICALGLLLAAFQVTCDGAPERLIPALKLPADVSQEEKLVEKRALCTPEQLDQSFGCPGWRDLGYCEQASVYYHFMQANCYQSCNNCEVPPTPPPKVPTTPPPKVDKEDCLAAHNAKRALHQNTDPLTWSDTLAQNAKEWADYLAKENKRDHDPSIKGVQGENIYWSRSSTVSSCKKAVESWYDEIKDYDYNDPKFGSGTGHFTQVVWRATTQVGAALAKKVNKDGLTETYVVARYSPAGNVGGQFENNVMPTK